MSQEIQPLADPIGPGADHQALSVRPVEDAETSSASQAAKAAAAAVAGSTKLLHKGAWCWIELMQKTPSKKRKAVGEDFGRDFRKHYVEASGRGATDATARKALQRLRSIGKNLVDRKDCRSAEDVARLSVTTQTTADKAADKKRRKPSSDGGKILVERLEAFLNELVEIDADSLPLAGGRKQSFAKSLQALLTAAHGACGWTAPAKISEWRLRVTGQSQGKAQ